MGGERGGGDVYFALDVTDTTVAGIPLWEYSVLKNKVLYAGSSRSLSACHDTPNNTTCKADMSMAYPFITDAASYDKLKVLPVAFSRPSVGRLNIPNGLTLFTGDPPLNGIAPTSAASFDIDGSPARHVAFVGGGIRLYQDDTSIIKDPSLLAASDPLSASQRFDLFRPDFMAIDIETGTNLLRYYWPIIQNQTGFYDTFPVIKSGNNYIPYSFSDPLALDVRNGATQTVGDDGFIDTVYVGDITGNFYGLKFNLDTTAQDADGNLVENSVFGIRVDTWQTKETYSGSPVTLNNTNLYRGPRQPVTVPPVASLDSNGLDGYFLRVIFGAGKHEDVSETGTDDKSDLARTSIYNLKDAVNIVRPDFFSSSAVSLSSGAGSFNIEVRPHVSSSVYNYPRSGDRVCTWTKTGAEGEEADCCEGNCNASCWGCVFDLEYPVNLPLSAGERVLRKAVISGGLAYIVTYVPPQSPCDALGESYLLTLSYNCGPIPGNRSIFVDPWVKAVGLKTGEINKYDPRGWRQGLGAGMASTPSISSDGTRLVIQMSTGVIHSGGTGGETQVGLKIDPPQKNMRVLGYRVR